MNTESVSPISSPSAASSISNTSVGAHAFKKPLPVPAPRKRFKKTVLDEDNFIRELESIVERDYFPDLKKLRVQNDFLEAAQSGDAEKVELLRSRYSTGGRQPKAALERPNTSDTWSSSPGSTPGTELLSSKENEDANNEPQWKNDSETKPDESAKLLSLNEYLATHTSEDDESFAAMMAEAKRRHQIKHPWLYAQEDRHNAREIALLNSEVPAVEHQADQTNRPGQVANWKFRCENELMYVPKGVALTADEKISAVKHKQEIMSSNTRFKEQPFNLEEQRAAVVSASLHRTAQGGKIGVDGREIIDTAKTASRGILRTPSPAPGVDASPLMTWGQIDGTPFRLDGGTPSSSVAGTPFRISEPPKRETLALQLAERASSRHRDKKNRALAAARQQVTSPAMSAALDRISTLSPAARRLARVGRATDQALRASYTPSPSQRRTAPATADADPNLKTPTPLKTPATVRRTPTVVESSSPPLTTGITDNLLRLPPSRQRAADFFN